MNLPNPYAQYRTTQVTTASHEKAIVMLHDGAIRSLQQALPAMKARDYYVQSKSINKAVAILAHMRGSLLLDQGTDLVKGLDTLYAYLIQRLNHASIHDETLPVEEAIRHLRTHREAWAEVARLAAESAHTSGASPIGGTPLGVSSRDLTFAA